MSLLAARRFVPVAWSVVLLLIACQEGTDVPRLIQDVSGDSCLPFDDQVRMQEILGGDWRVRTTQTVTSLTRCENRIFNGRAVSSDGTWVTYVAPWKGLAYESLPPIFVMSGGESGGRNQFTATIEAGT